MAVLRCSMALAVIVSACGPAKVDVSLQIVRQSCSNGTTDPLESVAFTETKLFAAKGKLLFDATAPAVHAVSQTSALEVPQGDGFVLEVRGFEQDAQSGGVLAASGRSAPFATVDGAGLPLKKVAVNVFLRAPGSLTPVVSAASPSVCGPQLTTPRAGHSANTLADGRVFLSGGFSGAPAHLSSTETYDPATGTFGASHPLSIENGALVLPRSEHSSTRLPNGQLLIWGGAVEPSQPSAVHLIYDAVLDGFGVLPTRNDPPEVPRTRHGAAADASGRVLIAGGLTLDDNATLVPANAVEWFDPATNRTFELSNLSLPRDGASVVAVQNGAIIAVAGGTDGTTLPREVKLFQFDGKTFSDAPVTVNPWLTAGRRNAAAAVVLGGTRLFLAGGHSDPVALAPMGSTEIIDTVIGQASPGPAIAPRGDACAVALDDHRVLLAGGEELDTHGALRSSGVVELVTFADDGTATVTALPSLPLGRSKHTCSLLLDGTVLIAGGVADQDGVETVLPDAYVFQP